MPVEAQIQVERPSYRQLFAIRSFTALVGVSTANVLGASLQILALSVLVYARTGSALWSSSAFAAGFLPQLVGGALLTSLADRWSARPLLAAAAALRAATAAALAVANLPSAVDIGLVAVVALVSPVPTAAQAALVARLVQGDLYVLGRSVFTLVSSSAQLAGLAAGGTVVGLLGARPALGIAAGVQLVGLVAIAALPRGGRRTAPLDRWDPRETWHGNSALLAMPVVRRIVLSWWIPITLLVGAESVVVAYVAEAGEPSWTTGALLAAFPAGAAVGNVVVGRWCGPALSARLGPWLLALVGIGLIPLALHPPAVIAFSCLFVANAGTAYELGGQRAFLEAVPEDRQGLALGLVSTGIMTGQGIGPVIAGGFAQLAGAGLTMTLLGTAIVSSARWLGRSPATG
jgi:MFS family permease